MSAIISNGVLRFCWLALGWIVHQTSYVFFFLYASALGIPAMLLVIYLMNRRQQMAIAARQT